MNVIQAHELLSELGELTPDLDVETGVEGKPPHDSAYLKLSSRSEPSNYAIVSTPGDGWFMLEVPGGYANLEFSEFNDDLEVRRILDRYRSAAIAYIRGDWSLGASRCFGIPFIIVETDGPPLKLQLSLQAAFRRAFRWRRHQVTS